MLADRIGCTAEAVHRVGMDRHDTIIYWMGKMSLVRCRDRFFRFSWRWIASLAFAYLAGSLLDPFLRLPKNPPANTLLLAVRKAA